jgi:glucokinase
MKKYYPGLTIALTNDANAAAIGEMVFGGAKEMKDFIVITLGTGLGSGIVVNGNLVYGQDGFAGELGHVNAQLNGRDCGCGRKGCLEAYASATGIRRTVFWLLSERMIDSELREVSFNDLTAKMISEAAQRGDLIAQEAFNYTGWILGTKLADTVAHNTRRLFSCWEDPIHGAYFPTKSIWKKTVAHIPQQGENSAVEFAGYNAGVLGAGALA